MSSTRGAGDDVVYDAVMAMKQAVDIAIKHGDIRPNTVCKGVGMSTSQLTQWLNSRCTRDAPLTVARRAPHRNHASGPL